MGICSKHSYLLSVNAMCDDRREMKTVKGAGVSRRPLREMETAGG